MRNEFFELPQRIQDARSDAAQEDFALYVRSERIKLGVDRAALAQQTGLERSFLAFLENGLLLPGELTQEIREKIEKAFQAFQRSDRQTIADSRQDWVAILIALDGQ